MEQLKDIVIVLGVLTLIFIMLGGLYKEGRQEKDTKEQEWINKILEEDEKRFAEDDKRINKKLKELEEKRRHYDISKKTSEDP